MRRYCKKETFEKHIVSKTTLILLKENQSNVITHSPDQSPIEQSHSKTEIQATQGIVSVHFCF
jgi:hypothetical protein